MVFGETKRGWWREARSDLLVVSTLAAKIAKGSPKNASLLYRSPSWAAIPIVPAATSSIAWLGATSDIQIVGPGSTLTE